MDQNGQSIAHSYAYYSSGEEDYAAAGHGVSYGGQVQHQYVMQNPSVDMNQMRPQMQVQMQQHGPYALHPHPSMQPQIAQVQYDQNANVGPIYHQHVASTPPPVSPYDPVSPAQSLSDHSASGTESAGAVSARVGGVPILPARVYHHHSHSHSSQSSTSSLHGEHPYATPHFPGPARGHSRTRSIGSRSVETTPPPGHPHGSDDDDNFGTHDVLEPYVNQISLLNRKESTRRQRIQAEQRRRDELRDGYSRLKEVLPITTSKSSKVSLIERARLHIIDIDAQNAALKEEVEKLKKENDRLQKISDHMAERVTLPLPPPPHIAEMAAYAAAAPSTETGPSRNTNETPEPEERDSTSPMHEDQDEESHRGDSEREKTPAA